MSTDGWHKSRKLLWLVDTRILWSLARLFLGPGPKSLCFCTRGEFSYLNICLWVDPSFFQQVKYWPHIINYSRVVVVVVVVIIIKPNPWGQWNNKFLKVFGQHFGLGHKVIEKLVVGLLLLRCCCCCFVLVADLLCSPLRSNLFYYTSGESFTKTHPRIFLKSYLLGLFIRQPASKQAILQLPTASL